MRVEPLTDNAVRIELDPNTDRRAVLERLRSFPGAIDAMITETHGCVIAEDAVDAGQLEAWLGRLTHDSRTPISHRVEVIYDGPDLDEVASGCGISSEELVHRHSLGAYTVSFLGFLPGFAYLRGLDAKLVDIRRRAEPRVRVDQGAVAMAGGFTAIYPVDSPGGWNVIGRVENFDPFGRSAFEVGDTVQFVVKR